MIFLLAERISLDMQHFPVLSLIVIKANPLLQDLIKAK